jgi:hypothetical protein
MRKFSFGSPSDHDEMRVDACREDRRARELVSDAIIPIDAPAQHHLAFIIDRDEPIAPIELFVVDKAAIAGKRSRRQNSHCERENEEKSAKRHRMGKAMRHARKSHNKHYGKYEIIGHRQGDGRMLSSAASAADAFLELCAVAHRETRWEDVEEIVRQMRREIDVVGNDVACAAGPVHDRLGLTDQFEQPIEHGAGGTVEHQARHLRMIVDGAAEMHEAAASLAVIDPPQAVGPAILVFAARRNIGAEDTFDLCDRKGL